MSCSHPTERVVVVTVNRGTFADVVFCRGCGKASDDLSTKWAR